MTTPINPLPIPPTPADSPVDFNTKAFALLGALPAFVTEANALQADVTAKQGTASSAAATAATDAAAATTKAAEAAASELAAQGHAASADESEAGAGWWAGRAVAEAAAAATSATNAGNSATAAASSAASIAGGPVASWAGLTGIITQAQAWATVRSAVMLGLSTTTSTVVAAADSVLVAIGKLQAQVSLRAPLKSPVLTGTPTTPTPEDTDNSTQVVNSTWIRTSMANIASAAGFAASSGVNGYLKFPSWLGGIVFQWGSSVISLTSGSAFFSFPITFPTAKLTQLVTDADGVGNVISIYTGSGLGASPANMAVYVLPVTGVTPPDGTPYRINWLAIGY